MICSERKPETVSSLVIRPAGIDDLEEVRTAYGEWWELAWPDSSPWPSLLHPRFRDHIYFAEEIEGATQQLRSRIEHQELYMGRVGDQLAALGILYFREFNPDTGFWQRTSDGHEMGSSSAFGNLRYAYINNLIVHSGMRGRGYGQTMMQRLEAEALRQGYPEIQLKAYCTKRNMLFSFYSLLGYQYVGVSMHRGEPFIRMAKRLVCGVYPTLEVEFP